MTAAHPMHPRRRWWSGPLFLRRHRSMNDVQSARSQLNSLMVEARQLAKKITDEAASGQGDKQ